MSTSPAKLELGASRNLHHQRIAFQRHHRFAEARVGEIAGQRCERRELPRIGSLASVSNLVFAALSVSAT